MNNKKNGITLIALVVTIIILIILASVTINTTLTENGLFDKAKNAGKDYTAAEKSEMDYINRLEKYADDATAEITGAASTEATNEATT